MENPFLRKKKQGTFSLHGLKSKETKFGAYIRDRWNNTTDTLVAILTPRFEKPLDRTKPKQLNLQGDPAFLNSDYSFGTIWDNNFRDPVLITIADGNWPQSISFDLGYPEVLLSRVRLWQRSYEYPEIAFNNYNIRKFEIWGSMNPDLDGSDESWTLLMDEEIIKPSGQPLGVNSDEDMQEFYDGHPFTFPLDIPYVRYLRIKVKGTWNNVQRICLAELRLWGMEPSDIEK